MARKKLHGPKHLTQAYPRLSSQFDTNLAEAEISTRLSERR